MFGSALMALSTPIMQLSGEAASPYPTVAITEDMLSGLINGVVANISAVLPMCLGIFTIFLGIRIIPSFISRFARF